jgi:hypothetical protein
MSREIARWTISASSAGTQGARSWISGMSDVMMLTISSPSEFASP